jgi:integrase
MPRKKRRNWGGCNVEKVRRHWRVRFSEDGKRKRLPDLFETEALAQRAADIVSARLRGNRHTGILEQPKACQVTLAELGDAFIEQRQAEGRDYLNDRSRWKKHLKPAFGKYLPQEVDDGLVMKFVREKLNDDELSEGTVTRCVHLLSALYERLVKNRRETFVTQNPVRLLSREDRASFKSRFDPRETPYLEDWQDVVRLIAALEDPVKTAYAIGVYTGMRPGEILGLDWTDVRVKRSPPMIWVHQQVTRNKLKGRTKDREHREVLIQHLLVPILEAWRKEQGGRGLLFGPVSGRGGMPGHPAQYLSPNTLRSELSKALLACKLPDITWYEATKHTFASHWLLRGRSIEHLAVILGHSDAETSRRYGHVRPNRMPESNFRVFEEEDVARVGPRGGTNWPTTGHVRTDSADCEVEKAELKQ